MAPLSCWQRLKALQDLNHQLWYSGIRESFYLFEQFETVMIQEW